MEEKRTTDVPVRPMRATVPARLVAMLTVFVFGIGTIGYFYFLTTRQEARSEGKRLLAAIADGKSESIADWYNERMQDARVIAEGHVNMDEIARFLQDPAAEDANEAMAGFFKSHKNDYKYSSLGLFDASGVLRFSEPKREADELDRDCARKAIAEGKIAVIDISGSGAGAAGQTLRIAAPCIENTGSVHRRAIGAVLFRIDPQTYLYPLIRRWPVPSASQETLLVRREGDEVSFLNEMRYADKTPFARKLPVSRSFLPAAQAVRGFVGEMEGVDYRGVKVIASIRPVRGTEWYMVAKIDESEIYKKIAHISRAIAAFCLLLAALFSALLMAFWHREQARHFWTQQEKEVERKALTEHYSYLTKFANDIIILCDSSYAIIEANDRARGVYGYAREELIGMLMVQLFSPEKRSAFFSVARGLVEGGGTVYETVHMRKDGTKFPAEVSSRAMTIKGKTFLQSIVRDITERQQAKARIAESEQMYRELVESVNSIIMRLDNEGLITFVNDFGERFFGFDHGELIGKNVVGTIVPGAGSGGFDPAWFDSTGFAMPERTSFGTNKNITKDGRNAWVAWTNKVLVDANGERTGILIIGVDVSEQRMMEEKVVRLNRVYSVLVKANEAIVRMRQKQPLFEEICRIAVEDGEFKMAFIGLTDERGEWVKTVAAQGTGSEELWSMRMSAFDNIYGRGCVGVAIRNGSYDLSNDVESDPRLLPWREEMLKRSVRSVVSFALKEGEATIGAFTVYAGMVNAFDTEEVSLLLELANDLSFALTSIKHATSFKEAEERSREK